MSHREVSSNMESDIFDAMQIDRDEITQLSDNDAAALSRFGSGENLDADDDLDSDDVDRDEPVVRHNRQPDENDEDNEDEQQQQQQLDPFGQQQQVPNQQQQLPEPPQQQQQQFAHRDVVADRQGNLINPTTGKIVAKAGVQARMYQSGFSAARQEVNDLRSFAHDTRNRLDQAVNIAQQVMQERDNVKQEYEKLSAAAKQAALSPQEHIEALNFAAMAKSNPVQFIKNVLTRAHANGIKLDELGIAQNGGIDAASLMSMLDQRLTERLAPVTQQAEQVNQQRQAETERAQRERETIGQVQSFFDQNPDMVQYAPIFKGIYESGNPALAGMTLPQIQSAIYRNLAKRGAANQQPQNQQQQNLGQPPRVPNGRGNVPAPQRDGVASVDTSYDDIIKDALRSAGMR